MVVLLREYTFDDGYESHALFCTFCREKISCPEQITREATRLSQMRRASSPKQQTEAART
jgi:hypothetical protein